MTTQIFTNIRKDWEILMYLSHRNRREIKNYVDDNPLLFHWRYLTFKDIFIEIDKMISHRSKGKDKPKTLQGKIIDTISNSDLSEKNKLELRKRLSKRLETIKQITSVRDKYYAHLDKDFKGYLGGIRMNDLRKLIFVVQGILVRVYGKRDIEEILKEIPSSDDYDLIERLID